ncbi:MAG: hypothetical protein PHY02_10500 [Phycisphaerae bacterium]|nr:hypothetical protein [Phycisphaerae bacterium]
MELSWLLVFKIGASLAGVVVGIGSFSELSWPVKLKITAVLLAGIILIGLLAWPLAAPIEPLGVVSMPGFGGSVVLAGLAILAGFIGYFLSWPDGREIGILAVPAGLAIWAVCSGSMAELMRTTVPTLTQRQSLLAAMKWEPIFWLAIVAAGFIGVLIAQRMVSRSSKLVPRPLSIGSIIIAVVGSGLTALLCIGLFAQDIRIADSRLGSVVAQPAVGQIVFAVFVSFGIAAFLVKKFLNAGYLWPIVASALVTGFAVITYTGGDKLQYLTEHYPPAFFYLAATSILPVQMVAFGVLGSIAGYWLAVRYNYWRENLSVPAKPES